MKAIVFDTTADNGVINIPTKFRKKLSNSLRVILLPGEESKVEVNDKARQRHLEVIKNGGSGTSISDPVAWQREMRKDKKQPKRK